MAIRKFLLAMLCGSGFVFAQFQVSASRSGDHVTLTCTPNDKAAEAAITERPYSATLTTERTTPDGTRMVQPARRVYRDSQGRTRTEEEHVTIDQAAPFLAVTIVDPVAGYTYFVDSENHATHRYTVKVASRPAARPRAGCATTPPAGTFHLPGGIVAVTEPLAEQNIDGAIFCGSKRTATYPAGSMFHNDQPVRDVTETWNAWEDGLPFFLVKHSSPGGETSLSWVKEISLSEPDPALFRPPGDSTIVEERGSFSVQLARAVPTSKTVLHVVALTGMGFSAEEVYESVRTDPNGAALTQRFSLFHYRDGIGRTVFGSMVSDSSGNRTFRPSMLLDPVAGYRYQFDSQATTVYRHPLQASFQPASQAARPKPANPDVWLGTQKIDGFETFGRRMTMKYAVGTLGGNDRPLVIVDESWNSPQLGIALLTKRSHPEEGETTGRVRNLILGEPEADLFRVPEGCRIVE